MSSELSSKLVDLLGFPKNDTWNQIYQGKIDGFRAGDFHSRCDYKSKTVTIIHSTNGYIFGGYTDLPWGTGAMFRTDAHSFIFSMVNSLGRPIKFPIKSSNVEESVYMNSNYGPVFGNWDLRIESYANSNNYSFSELGRTFNTSGIPSSSSQDAYTFLAGAQNFQVLDIVVYQRLSSDTYYGSKKMLDDIVNLVEFPKSDLWSIIYRGSVHGFNAKYFHSTCDDKYKTLMVIQSANNWIFGGYTDVGWGTGGMFMADPNAFLFSLTNPSYRPAKFPIKTGNTEALYWNSNYGPGFGNWDLFINTYADIDGYNKETIGFSYNTSQIGLFANSESEGFLTGARNFIVNDIIIYQRIQSNTYFLSSQMYADLVSLTGLPSSDRWNMLYRGNVNGFSSGSFYSRCAGKPKTLVLIESTNNFVFGGYTDVGWGSGGRFISDSNAFIFSLTNSKNKPSLFPVKTGSADQAVYWNSNLGPVFGNYDLYIESNANGNANSFSNLGTTYNTSGVFGLSFNDASSFLAGSSNFQINDIVVFQII